MKRKFICFVLIFVLLVSLISSLAFAEGSDYIVYITKSGTKYHRDGCSYLKSKYEISLGEAVRLGYTPCSRCKPPTLDNASTVVETPKPQRSTTVVTTPKPQQSTTVVTTPKPQQSTTNGSRNGNSYSENPPYIIVGPVTTPTTRSNPSSSTTRNYASSNTTQAYSSQQTAGKAYSFSPFGIFVLAIIAILFLKKVFTPKPTPQTEPTSKTTPTFYSSSQSQKSDVPAANRQPSSEESYPFDPYRYPFDPDYSPGMHLFFWDKRANMIGELVVTAVYSDFFTFTYRGKQFKCPFSEAAGKLFLSAKEVPRRISAPSRNQ